jgi:hypothetical protein
LEFQARDDDDDDDDDGDSQQRKIGQDCRDM